VTVEDRGHTAYPYLNIWIDLTQRVDHSQIVGDELIAVIGPVAGIGIVEAKMDDGLVGGKAEGIAPSLLTDVRKVATIEQCGARMTKVAHLVAIAQHLRQTYRIRGTRRVTVTIAVGDAVAYAGYADRVVGHGNGADQDETKQNTLKAKE
jgi:hypothetical protein